MRLKTVLCVFCIIALSFAGCILDDSKNGDADKDGITGIDELTMGGGVFVFWDLGYGMAQFATFHGMDPYEDADVFINGIQMAHNSGFHTNTGMLSIEQLVRDQKVRIAVYALGDSVVKEIAVPESPVIVKPGEGAVVTAGSSLDVSVGFPGEHQYVAVTLADQGFAEGWELPADKEVSFTLSGENIPNAGTFPLQAYSVNTSGAIPDNFDIANQYKMFLVASVTVRSVEFSEAE